ncbi:MAG: LysR family transcriptional regulator [Oscillibacter sp.]|nr:LysR family transcriptional regulator [Oscillibacter sp.]
MKIEQLEQAIKIAELNSISLAAENLFLSQPNLSLSIKKLETEIGYPIFVRTNKGVETTPLGQNFVDFARIILLQFRQLQHIGAYTAKKDQLAFSMAHMHYRYINHAAAELFNRHQNQDFRMEVHEGIRDQVVDMVERRVCEIGLIGMYSHYHKMTLKQLETKGLQYFRLCSSPVSVIVGKGSPLFQLPKEQEEISLDTIRDLPIVIFKEMELGPYTSVLDALGLDSQTSRVVVSERSTIGDILDKSEAYSITTTNRIAYQNTDYYPTMRHFKLKDCSITGEIGWIKRSDTIPSSLALEFLQILSTYFTIVNGVLPL